MDEPYSNHVYDKILNSDYISMQLFVTELVCEQVGGQLQLSEPVLNTCNWTLKPFNCVHFDAFFLALALLKLISGI